MSRVSIITSHGSRAHSSANNISPQALASDEGLDLCPPKKELDKNAEVERRTANGRLMVKRFQLYAEQLDPLFHQCRRKVLPDVIREALLLMVECCMKQDYTGAESNYIDLSIGNDPWPIGDGMVGIHGRPAREKICNASSAHIMNDETTRKYLQSVKRLVTFCSSKLDFLIPNCTLNCY
ncbi:hypothetical protein Tsubulata_019472 [Turnera subulata]|uniref:Pre-mRNA-splicing factor 18 n=1 Tax=Turnera subulata TaxID=218843 RepID=A0A9Q0JKZ7_9ROSI|nr:hypothetical protein Tsubulata_019472 [Turnera subulata]